MSLYVNSNSASLNAQGALRKTSIQLDKAMERLSSGLRVNRSADDAAGLAIATGMTSQVRGMTQAVRNIGDGLSAIATADGAMTRQTEILQRIRELAVQASNGLNTGENLATIQNEIDSEVEELTRIGDTTEFNGHALLDGTFASKKIQVGSEAGQTIEMTIGEFRSASMGAYAKITGATTIDATVAISGSASGVAGGVEINNVTVGASTSDGISYANGSSSAIAKAKAINDVSSQTGVTAEAGAASVSGTAAVGAATTATTDAMTINGVQVVGSTAGHITTTANDGTGSLRAAINAKSNDTGVVATLDASNQLVLTAADGRNIQTTVASAVAVMTTVSGFAAGTLNTSGTVDLYSNDTITVASNNVNILGMSATSVSQGVDSSKVIAQLDVTTATGAADALRSVDSALQAIADGQAGLGAMTNRLEHTIDNLATSIENTSAARSRIMDADFAIETAAMTRAQIIQQAGTSILAQANMRPQAALSLLG